MVMWNHHLRLVDLLVPDPLGLRAVPDPGLIKFAPLMDVFGAQLYPLALRLDFGTTILAFNVHLGGS